MTILSRNNNSFITPLFLILSSISAVCQADALWQWTDAAGVVHFGSKPPRNAAHVTAFSGKPLSRYSTARQLTRFGVANTEALRGGSKKASRNFLEQGPVELEQSPDNTITSCKVSVKNRDERPAENVIVTFQFKDGTLIPGEGPGIILEKQEATYLVPPAHLPIKLDEKILAELQKQLPPGSTESQTFEKMSREPTVLIEYNRPKK